MGLKILIVEDERDNMAILMIGLQHLGHQVIGAYNPELGLQLARSEQPDVILMDLSFQGASMDGVEAIRRLKADPATAHIPIVAETASVHSFSAPVVAEVGAQVFLRKPFNRRTLSEAIEAAIAARDVSSSQP